MHVRRGWFIVPLVGLLLAACSGTQSSSEKPNASNGTPTGTLKIAIAELPPAAADPAKHVGKPAVGIWPAFYDGLTRIDSKSTPQPWLATKWETEGGTTWRFTLRQDVRFSNGEPFNADAVVTAAKNILFGYGKEDLVRTNLLPNVTQVRKVDTYTVDFQTDGPDPLMPKRVAQFYPLPPKYFAQAGQQAFARKPIGTGPFVVDNWSATEVKMHANPDAWHKPKVANLDFIEIPDSTARLQALQSHQVNIAQDLAPSDADKVKQAGGSVVVGADPRLRMIGLVAQKQASPVHDPAVRQALNYAVDKEAIVKAFDAGLAAVGSQPAIKIATGYDPSIQPYPYDPAKAKSLLAGAGYPNGFKMLMEAVVTTASDRQIYEAVANYLSKVGVQTEVRAIQFDDWRQKLFNASWAGDAFSFSLAFDPTFDLSRQFGNITCQAEHAFYCSPAMTPLQKKAEGEFDQKTRTATLQQISKMMHDDPPGIFLDERIQVDGLYNTQSYDNPNLILYWNEVNLS